MALLEVQNVVKEFRGGALANDGVSLSVEPGEVYGLLGPNGAGKTTLVSHHRAAGTDLGKDHDQRGGYDPRPCLRSQGVFPSLSLRSPSPD